MLIVFILNFLIISFFILILNIFVPYPITNSNKILKNKKAISNNNIANSL
jgi:hypothetical protein